MQNIVKWGNHMKIYFEDGELKPTRRIAGVDYLYSIDASRGYSYCKNILNYAKLSYPNDSIYTNSIAALSNEYCWNDELGVAELYLRDVVTKKFVRVDMLTDKEIRKPHNLMHIYMNDGFRKSVE